MILPVCALKPFLPFFTLWMLSEHPDALALAQAADSFGVPHRVMWAVAWAETRHNVRNNQVSIAGARGRMQILPRVWRGCKWWHWRNNIHCGAAILRFYYDETGNWQDAIYLYHGRGAAGRRYQRQVERKMGELLWKRWMPE